MHLTNVGPLWLRRYAVFVACCSFVLVIAGGLVTSNDAALSVPDWPLSWGRLVPNLVGGIRYEFAHRALAALVGLLTIGLAVGNQADASLRVAALMGARSQIRAATVRGAAAQIAAHHRAPWWVCRGLGGEIAAQAASWAAPS